MGETWDREVGVGTPMALRLVDKTLTSDVWTDKQTHIHIDDDKSKPSMSFLLNVQESGKN